MRKLLAFAAALLVLFAAAAGTGGISAYLASCACRHYLRVGVRLHWLLYLFALWLLCASYLDGENLAGGVLLDLCDHLIEHVKAFLGVCDSRIRLTVGAKSDAAA